MTDGVELISRFLITRGVAKGKFENFREFFISSNSLSGCQISDGISNLCQRDFALLVRRRLSIRFWSHWLEFTHSLINTRMKSCASRSKQYYPDRQQLVSLYFTTSQLRIEKGDRKKFNWRRWRKCQNVIVKFLTLAQYCHYQTMRRWQ